jgi:hypothetical protein
MILYYGEMYLDNHLKLGDFNLPLNGSIKVNKDTKFISMNMPQSDPSNCWSRDQ